MSHNKRLKIALSPLILSLLLIATANIVILSSTQNQIYNDVDQVRPGRIGLVLGCPPTVVGGSPNTYFEQRMNAAALLMKNNKITTLILSGATDGGAYNEPLAMRQALLKRGLKDAQLELDLHGNRTFDSIKNVQQKHTDAPIIIITQQAHARRALFIAQHFNINAKAFNAQTQGFSNTLTQTIRESLARVRAIVDIYLLSKLDRSMKQKN